jgi:hypothetical protein
MGSGMVSEPSSSEHGLEQDPEPMHSLWVYTNALTRTLGRGHGMPSSIGARRDAQLVLDLTQSP